MRSRGSKVVDISASFQLHQLLIALRQIYRSHSRYSVKLRLQFYRQEPLFIINCTGKSTLLFII